MLAQIFSDFHHLCIFVKYIIFYNYQILVNIFSKFLTGHMCQLPERCSGCLYVIYVYFYKLPYKVSAEGTGNVLHDSGDFFKKNHRQIF